MARWLLSALCVLVSVAMLTGSKAAYPGTPTPVATPFDCPLTKPNGNQPPGKPPSPGGYGNDALWTTLTMRSEQPGIVPAPNDGHLQPDGSVIEMKWAWFRFVPGKLTIEGRRLDTPAPPLEAVVPEGYGDSGFTPSGITFPSDGCWEITGRVGDGGLTFVVLVVYPDGWTPVASPMPKATP